MVKARASVLCLLAAAVVLLLGLRVRAGGLHRLELALLTTDNPLPRTLPTHEELSHPPADSIHKLTLADAQPTSIPALLVGYRAPVLEHAGYQNLDIRPSEDLRDQWNFMRRATSGPSALERLGSLFDVEEDERPWSTVTTVHILTSSHSDPGSLVPFATVAHEVDVNEDMSRIGIGAGAMLILSKHATLGAEVVHFGDSGDHAANDSFSTETRFLARLQLSF
jgi:hypothetical protein